MPAVTCALAVPSASKAGMDAKRSVVPALVDVETAGPRTCMEPKDNFLDFLTLFKKRFISLVDR